MFESGLLPLALIWIVVGCVLSVIDIREHRLPDAIVLRMYPVVLMGLVVAGWVTGSWHWSRALAGAGIWLMAIGGAWLLTAGRGMGFGDVKLAPLLGATLGWLGWQPALAGLFCAWVLGGCWALGLLMLRRANRHTAVAFGPFLILGFWAAFAASSWVVTSSLGVAAAGS
ncbi:MAG: A24 family peptidase [Candidatus Nanopelagicales bacterium]